MIGDGGKRHIRYPASEKLEIIRLVERSHIGVRPTLAKLGIPKTTFYRRYDRYLAFGRGWFYLSTIHDDYSRYIIAWKLCTTTKTKDVTDTLKLALQASDFDRAKVMHKPRLLSDNGSSYISEDLAEWLAEYKWITCGALHTIHRHRARSSVGIKRLKTESYWRTIICRVIWKNRSASSSITKTNVATTRA